ncbi:MAG: flavodoxin family protein [Opitutales bacterium]|nr:flavodoxin family protein [Opitutales bacterium]
MKKILILSGSPRKGGNSDTLCDEFIRGARESGHQTEKIFVCSKKIAPCKGCYFCQKHKNQCAIGDDMPEILDKIQSADAVVMATPVYFYSIGAQLKALIDRCVARWENISGKEFFYIMTAAEDSPEVMDCTLECLRGFAKCIAGSRESGVLKAKGVYQIGDVKNTPYMRQAYLMGKSA